MFSAEYKNRLQFEKSPYLLQHADNPVDWRPWGDEAFSQAAREDKPIFLSIGYSTCHWCHVMAHESFEDPEVAALMNENFINIKVDREERPDIDAVYMHVCQLMTGSGGWPLTIFMKPDKQPFYAATYIPKRTRFGLMGMTELLPRVAEIWRTRRHNIDDTAHKIIAALNEESTRTQRQEPELSILDTAAKQLLDLFDKEHGGFGKAPKFPTPQNLIFLLRYWKRNGDCHALEAVVKTLHAMRCGGIYDHIGLGFHRYSVDETWTVPHFEKMLYDQAMLAYAYTEAYQATHEELFARTAREIFAYVTERMTSPDGAFFSAEDADSEGVEGKFYLWEWDEIQAILSKEEMDIAAAVYRIDKSGNYFDEASGRKTGKNILRLHCAVNETAGALSMVENIRRKLSSAREKRTHPHKDDKILTDWNGLMIAAFAKGYEVFGDSAYLSAAQRASLFLQKNLSAPAGRLNHRFRAGEAGIKGQLNDYAFLAFGFIELYEASFNASYLREALDLTDALLVHFLDREGGGFFTTPHDGEPMIVRQKEIFEGAMPSGASIAVWNMLRLGHLTGNAALLDRAANVLTFYYPALKRSPGAFPQFMVALDFAFGPVSEVVIAMQTANDENALLGTLRNKFLPNKVVARISTDDEKQDIYRLAPYTQSMKAIDNMPTAYVCRGNSCREPTTDIAEMLAALS